MIKELMSKKGLTLSELSKKVGISKGYLSKLINGNFNNPTVKIILSLAKELDVCPIKLFLILSKIDCDLDNGYY